MTAGKWLHSIDGEFYRSDEFDTKEEAIADGKTEYGGKDFYVGKSRDVSVLEVVSCSDLIETARDRSSDEWGEIAEDWLSDDPSQEAEDEMNDFIVEWFGKHNLSPRHFMVINSERAKANS